jgi:hypothetical protein
VKIGTIRHAAPNDLRAIVDMGREFFEQSGSQNFTTFDESSFIATTIALMSGVSGGIILVAEVAEECVGMASSVMFPFYCNNATKISQEIFWFVKPDCRNGIGATLLDELEAEALRGGAHVFLTAALPGLRDRAIGRVYEKRGYRPAENTFVKRLSS